MQVEDVGGRIFQLGRGQLSGAPVRALLRLGQVHARQFAHHILQPVPVGIGAGQLGRDLGAIDRPRLDPEMQLEHSDVEPAEVEQLEHRRIDQQPLQIRAVIGRPVQPHDMGVAVAGRQLHHAQRIASETQPHGFGIDGDLRAEIEAAGQVAFVQMDGHVGILIGGDHKRTAPYR